MKDLTEKIREPYGVQFNPSGENTIDEMIEEDKYFKKSIVAYPMGCYGSDDEDFMNDLINAVGDKLGYMPIHLKGVRRGPYRKDESMKLKENYERFFGKIEEKKELPKTQLNEAMKQRFSNLSSALSRKYPNAPLTMKNGHVYIGFKKIEESTKFLSRTSLNIQELVRSISNSGKKGLL